MIRRSSVSAACLIMTFVAALMGGCSDGEGSSCTTDMQCAAGQRCVRSACVRQVDGAVDGGDALDDLAGGDGSGDSATDGTPDGPPSCRNDMDCAGGVCVNRQCCPSAERACGTVCCSAGSVCFANACVTAGRECRRAADCDPGQYCEPGLGPGARTDAGFDGGPTDASPMDVPTTDGARPDATPTDAAAVDTGAGDGGARCFGGATATGRCVSLPPRCDADGGTPDGGAADAASTDSGTGGPSCLPACEYRPPVGRLDAVRLWRWGPTADTFSNYTDVWATPTVGRVTDTNCDGVVNGDDPPNVIFVSGNAAGSCCSCARTESCRDGVLRVLDGRSGREVWSLRRPSATSMGFAGNSVAIGDVDGDRRMDIVALSGEGNVVWIDRTGRVIATSTQAVPLSGAGNYGWGGGLAIADMDGDGAAEVAFGGAVFTLRAGTITQRFVATTGNAAGTVSSPLSTFANVDADPDLELVIGRAAHNIDGSQVWARMDLPDGFPAIGDFNRDGSPEVVLVANGQMWILSGTTGATLLGPLTLPGTGNGGPPTVADFDGDRVPEIGVALQNFYTVVKADLGARTIRVLWRTPNHDLSSSVTGSTVFDFEGDGIAEVIYNDECFLWVFDGPTGRVRFATPTTSFTATEASLVADVDGDGHAEIVMVANGADPSAAGWGCNVAPWNMPDAMTGRPAWAPPMGGSVYRGITVFGDRTSSWVGSRTLWNQHTYHVTNICDDGDRACVPAGTYGRIPARERSNWNLGWLNNFRQNVQESGQFNAPDATVSLVVECTSPAVLRAALRNSGLAILPAGVRVEFYRRMGGMDTLLGTATSTTALFPGQATELRLTLPASADPAAQYFVRIVQDPMSPTFRECRDDNNQSAVVSADCIG